MTRRFAFIAALLMASAASAQPPRIQYMIHCLGCHTMDGTGVPGKVPNLRTEMPALLHVEGGREYMVQVPGSAQAPLSDAEVAAVLNFILDEFAEVDLPSGFQPYTAEEVARLRPDAPVDITETRAKLLEMLESKH